MSAVNRAENARAKCPYYADAEKNRIRCESCVKGARLYFTFGRMETLARHRQRYCDSYRWYECPYAEARTREWEEKTK